MKSDISQAIARPSSYLETENLEIQERVINLGKRLLNYFQNNDPDEITVWMINYLAEQIDMAETTSSQETKRKCFETIIKLWESRSSFPNGARPFESLEPVFSVLDSLNTESSIPRYYINRVPEKNWSQEDESVIKRLEMIKMLDSNARVLISFLLEQAVDEAVTDEAREWIDAVSGIERVPEIDFLVRFYGEKIDPKKDKAEKLQKRIEELKAFEEMSRTVRQNLENLVHSDFFGNK